MVAVVELTEGHVYRLPNGREFVARAADGLYELPSRAEWHAHARAAYAVEAGGTITFQGFDTGWRVSDLRDTGRSGALWAHAAIGAMKEDT